MTRRVTDRSAVFLPVGPVRRRRKNELFGEVNEQSFENQKDNAQRTFEDCVQQPLRDGRGFDGRGFSRLVQNPGLNASPRRSGLVSIIGLMRQAWYLCWLAMQCKMHGVRGCPGLQTKSVL
jgi:hypothetical protein